MSGWGNKKVKSLVSRKIESTFVGERALVAVTRMNKLGVTALPVVDELSKKLLSELSIQHLQAVKADQFGILMRFVFLLSSLFDSIFCVHASLSTVGHLIESVNNAALAIPASLPLKKTTCGQVLAEMERAQRTHVWITNKGKSLNQRVRF